MRVAIYARVSTQEQADEEVPIAAQVRECTDYALAKGWTVVAVFKDEGISGHTDARPGFQEMIASAKQQPKPFWAIRPDPGYTEQQAPQGSYGKAASIEVHPYWAPVVPKA